jgi:hypothetical protein
MMTTLSRRLGAKPVDSLKTPPAPGWKLQVRGQAISFNGKMYGYGSTIEDLSVLDGSNVGALFRTGRLAWAPPEELAPASAPAPRVLPAPVYARPNPQVTIVEVFGDPVGSWRKSVAATAATLDDGSPVRAFDLLLNDARGYGLYQKANAQNYADQVRAKGRPGGPIVPL